MERNITKSKFLEDEGNQRAGVSTTPCLITCNEWGASSDFFRNDRRFNANVKKPQEQLGNSDSYTQTSKTIMQLAKLEERQKQRVQRRQLSPDSLMTTPRESLRALFPNPIALETKRFVEQYKRYEMGELPKDLPRRTSRKSFLTAKNFTREFYGSNSLTETFLRKRGESTMQHNRSKFLQQTSPLRNLHSTESESENETEHQLTSVSYVEPSKKIEKKVQQSTVVAQKFRSNKQHDSVSRKFPNIGEDDDTSSDTQKNATSSNNSSNKSDNVRRTCIRDGVSFMAPTVSSEQRNESSKIQGIRHMMATNSKRSRSLSQSNAHHQPIPITTDKKTNTAECKTKSTATTTASEKSHSKSIYSMPPGIGHDMKLNLTQEGSFSVILESNNGPRERAVRSTPSNDGTGLNSIVNRIKNVDWTVALRGMAEMMEICRTMDAEYLHPHMITVNQRLIELLRSPRSHVCRTACQAAGQFFESMKDTRRPEFDDIVELLLYKTADANKFIREDANVSLDCMVTHIPLMHSVRALCLKGPLHKNPLVRTATVRLLVCAVVVAGPFNVLSLPTLENTRKRIIMYLPKFMDDKNSETRKFGERLFRLLDKESIFELYLRRYLEKDEVFRLRSGLKLKKLHYKS